MEVCDIRENYSTGWIKIYRSIKNHWVWKDSKHFQIWIDFLMRANHKNSKIVIEGELVEILRGSFVTSLKKLAKEYHCSAGKIRHFLKILENDGNILLITTHKYTQITICNYETYQGEQQTERKQNDFRMISKRKQNDTDKNDKNKKNGEELKKVGDKEIKTVKREYFLDLLPVTLSQPDIDSWCEWVDYRTETKKKLTKRSAKKQIEFLLSQPKFNEVIDQSIKNQWQGLFEVKDGTLKAKGKETGTTITYNPPK